MSNLPFAIILSSSFIFLIKDLTDKIIWLNTFLRLVISLALSSTGIVTNSPFSTIFICFSTFASGLNMRYVSNIEHINTNATFKHIIITITVE